MRVITVFYLITALFLHFNLTTQWAKFSYESTSRIQNPYNNISVALYRYTICRAVLKVKKIKVQEETKACGQITETYAGIVKTPYKNYQYIVDCTCSSPSCTGFQVLCIYTC
uniref:Post-SET domain-containing protein n=1 Tax=Strongyloides venezuelensis TaxID=75913 RepID=A0A0K0EUJ7_STRVS